MTEPLVEKERSIAVQEFKCGRYTLRNDWIETPEGKQRIQIDVTEALRTLPEEFKCIDDEHPPTDHLRGNLANLMFSVYDGEDFVGAFQVYAIKILQETTETIQVSAIPSPALPNLTPDERNSLTVDLMEHFLLNSFETQEGKTLQIKHWILPTILIDSIHAAQAAERQTSYLLTRTTIEVVDSDDVDSKGRRQSHVRKRLRKMTG